MNTHVFLCKFLLIFKIRCVRLHTQTHACMYVRTTYYNVMNVFFYMGI